MPESDFFDAMEDITSTGKLHSKMFIYIIKQKDCLINELQDKIRILNAQIELLNKINSAIHIDENSIHNKPSANKKDEDKVSKKIVPIPDKNIGNSINNQNKTKTRAMTRIPEDTPQQFYSVASSSQTSGITPNTLSSALNEVNTKSTMEKYININKEEEWKTVHTRKKPRRNSIVGNNTDDKIKGVPKYVFLHVCRVDPVTTQQDLKDQLKKHFPEVTCELLTSKQPTIYSSFKVKTQMAQSHDLEYKSICFR
ncbi:unnamed protein product [Phaedon cochleariae]|uniref:Uncharacterized protein n=1 Tax=Phaedon cochleariae TaxID=80249 RepID=A0A9N9X1U6_PHACE|nr:unnamed protein product [Phaedon cochleariae]